MNSKLEILIFENFEKNITKLYSAEFDKKRDFLF